MNIISPCFKISCVYLFLERNELFLYKKSLNEKLKKKHLGIWIRTITISGEEMSMRISLRALKPVYSPTWYTPVILMLEG